MNRIIPCAALTLAAITPLTLRGADFPENPNRFSFGPRFGFNFKADFQNSAPYFNPVSPGPASGGANHTYDDGYVRVDSSGNLGGRTSNWGYQNSSQVAGDAMQFHAIHSSSSTAVADDPQYGAELTYQRVLGRVFSSSSANWGLEVGLGYTDLDLRKNTDGTAPVTTDTYPLNGVLPPGPGYNGPFDGPGPLLGDTPTRTTTSANRRSRQKLSGDLFSIRLGPFVEWNLTSKLSVAGSLGITVAPTYVDYDFSESVSVAGGDTYTASGHSSKSKLLYGPYLGGMIRYDFSKHWGVYVGAQFQNLRDLKQSIGSRTARLDQGATVYGTVGASWRF